MSILNGLRVVSVLQTERFRVRGRDAEFRRFGFAVTRRVTERDVLLDLAIHTDAIAIIPVDAPGVCADTLTALSASPVGPRTLVGIPTIAMSNGLAATVGRSTARLITTPVTPASLRMALAGRHGSVHPEHDDEVVRAGRCVVDHRRHEILIDDEPIRVGRNEFDFVAHIVAEHPHVATLEGLRSALGSPPDTSSDLLHRVMFRVRSKIRRACPDAPDPFESVSGVGYRLSQSAVSGPMSSMSPETLDHTSSRTERMTSIG